MKARPDRIGRLALLPFGKSPDPASRSPSPILRRRELRLVCRVGRVRVSLCVALPHELLVEHRAAGVDVTQEPAVLVDPFFIEPESDSVACELSGLDFGCGADRGFGADFGLGCGFCLAFAVAFPAALFGAAFAASGLASDTEFRGSLCAGPWALSVFVRESEGETGCFPEPPWSASEQPLDTSNTTHATVTSAFMAVVGPPNHAPSYDQPSASWSVSLPRCEYSGEWLWATPRSGLTPLPREPQVPLE
jgi:hypothetical protein